MISFHESVILSVRMEKHSSTLQREDSLCDRRSFGSSRCKLKNGVADIGSINFDVGFRSRALVEHFGSALLVSAVQTSRMWKLNARQRENIDCSDAQSCRSSCCQRILRNLIRNFVPPSRKRQEGPERRQRVEPQPRNCRAGRIKLGLSRCCRGIGHAKNDKSEKSIALPVVRVPIYIGN